MRAPLRAIYGHSFNKTLPQARRSNADIAKAYVKEAATNDVYGKVFEARREGKYRAIFGDLFS